MHQFIAIKDHPSSMDPTATLVSGPRERLSIFRVRGGYVACFDGMAAVGVFENESAARAALLKDAKSQQGSF